MNFFMYCYGLNISPPTPQNTYVKITPKVMVLGGGALQKMVKSCRQNPHVWNHYSYEKGLRKSSSPIHHGKT